MPHNHVQASVAGVECCCRDVSANTVDVTRQDNRRRHQTKEIILHQQRLPSVSLDDFVLFPNDDVVIVDKYSSVRDIRRKTRKAKKQPKVAKVEKLNPETMIVQQRPVRSSQPFLHHAIMNTTSKIVKVANAKNLDLKEPQTPTFRRLTTPDFSDDEELDFWSCCGSSRSSMTEKSDMQETSDSEKKWYVSSQV